jgi:hypothetical protein
MTPLSVRKVWHEVHVPAGTNIVRAAEIMAEMANALNINVMSNLNDIDCRIEPGANPEYEGKKIATALQKRSPA